MASWLNVPAQVAEILSRVKLIEANTNQIPAMRAQEKKIMDVLDTEIQAQAAMTSSLATLMTDVQTLIMDFQNNPPPAGSILSSDPRWGTLTNAISQAATTITTLDTSVKAALPPTP